MPLPKYDWEAVELEYKAGVLPLVSICLKHGMTIARLNIMARKMKWVRSEPPTPEEVYGIAATGNLPREAQPNSWHPDDVRKTAIITAQTVINTHRSDISKLRGSTALLIERLGLILNGQTIGKMNTGGDPADAPSLPCLGARESPADLLEKLSRVMVRTVQMERQSYGLESMAQNPGGDIADPGADGAVVKQVSDELAELRASIDSLSNHKAKEATKEDSKK